jgi:hypothetical protein
MSSTQNGRHETAGSVKRGLVDLPGELRNRIYHFVTEDGPITFTYASRRLREKLSDDEITASGIDQRVPRLIGLMQTCRQLRSEYLPLYAGQTTIRVFHVDIGEVMRSHFPFFARDNQGNATGNLLLEVIPLEITVPLRRTKQVYPIIDILPLIMYCWEHPGLRVSCHMALPVAERGDIWEGFEEHVKTICDLAAHTQLREWLNATVSAIEMEYGHPYIGIILKNGLDEDWVWRNGCSGRNGTDRPGGCTECVRSPVW